MPRRSRRSASSETPSRLSRAFASARPWLARASWAGAAAAIVAGWAFGVPRLAAAVAAGADAGEIEIVFSDRPPWFAGELETTLAETCRRQLGGDPFAQEDLVAVRDALVRSGWFDAVAQVRRASAQRIEIDAVLALPAAVVRDAEGDHLVDVTGRLLPRTFAHDGALSQIVIVGARFDRPQRPGAAWEGGDIVAALEVLRLFAGKPWRQQVAAVDVGRLLSDGSIVLRTDLGARIVWGAAPGEERPLEVPAPTKVRYLDDAFRTFGRIDTGRAAELHFYDQGYFAR